MSDPQLKEIRRLPAVGRALLKWSDGHEAEYDYNYLRGYCPCAGCQGHSVTTVEFHPPATGVTALSIKPVGNYALSFHWSDGHDTGIYRYAFLRKICPCDECREQGEAKPEL